MQTGRENKKQLIGEKNKTFSLSVTNVTNTRNYYIIIIMVCKIDLSNKPVNQILNG